MTYTITTECSGLAIGEQAVTLDDGHVIAVAVTPAWLANGAGVVISATARWIDRDGCSHTCPEGQHVTLTFSHTADGAAVARHGVQTLAREVLLMVLGEDATLIDYENGDGSTHSAPLIPWSDDVRLNASIRRAIACVAEVRTIDAASLL
ncbi:hypothetical protein QH494_02470 [Sphingomonas sp. AR_OL41]|uniref:hypothetical protein n=1 Tax=Sphingomonas sp. AR_OL41 TaxID=3042729 RepID=UPI00248035F3|nr:hypothetical protein [Sphingomonas sp. AR_OL41]MDH7971033.1 hypothetical protein [Sphingomonas sp. AR_OL41]